VQRQDTHFYNTFDLVNERKGRWSKCFTWILLLSEWYLRLIATLMPTDGEVLVADEHAGVSSGGASLLPQKNLKGEQMLVLTAMIRSATELSTLTPSSHRS
jgi:hypothetical protein